MSKNIAFPIWRRIVFWNINLLETRRMAGSNWCDSQIDEYHASVAQFRHAVCHRRSVRRQRFGLSSLFIVAADTYSRSLCEFFSITYVNSFLSLIWIKITSFTKSFDQLSLVWQSALISSPAGISLNASDQDRGENKRSVRQQIMLFNQLNDGFVAGVIGVIPAHLPRSHSLQYAHAWSAIDVLCVGAIFEN